MANHKSALKRIRSNEAKHLRTKYQHKTTRNAIKKLKSLEDEIQVVVSDFEHPEFKDLGKAQQPELWDYADGVDTLQFLLEA